MHKVAPLVLALLVATACDDDGSQACTAGVSTVSVSEPLAALDGESARARFDRASSKSWDCAVTWLELPETIASSEPSAGSSALTLTLERTSDSARYREYSPNYSLQGCQTDAVFVPCSLGLVSDDGALDEELECELRLQGANTLVNLVLPQYEFGGTHSVTFAEGIEPDFVEFNLAYTPGPDPTRIDGSIVESGTRSGADPYLTTALIACAAP